MSSQLLWKVSPVFQWVSTEQRHKQRQQQRRLCLSWSLEWFTLQDKQSTTAAAEQRQSSKQALSFCLSSASLTFVFCVLLSSSCSLCAALCVFICVCESSGVMRLKVLLRIAPLPSLAQPLPCSLSLPLPLPLCRRRCLCAFGLAMQFKLFDNSEKCIWLTKAHSPPPSLSLCLSVRVISGQRRDVGERWSWRESEHRRHMKTQ